MKTRIEWVRNQDGSQGYSINPVKGLCPVDCKDAQGKSYCYARRMYKRFKWNERIEWDEQCLLDLRKIKKPSRIFVGSTMELFGDWIHPDAMGQILGYCKNYPQHTFILLTKCPEQLLRWSPFPQNCYIGATVTNQEMHNRAIACLAGIKASVKFISYEPLLSEIEIEGAYDLSEIQWVIIGQCTPPSKKTAPKLEWIAEIIGAADKANLSVFLKKNLHPLLPIANPFMAKHIIPQDEYSEPNMARLYRQEFPDDKK